jgi:hypothetical protein
MQKNKLTTKHQLHCAVSSNTHLWTPNVVQNKVRCSSALGGTSKLSKCKISVATAPTNENAQILVIMDELPYAPVTETASPIVDGQFTLRAMPGGYAKGEGLGLDAFTI